MAKENDPEQGANNDTKIAIDLAMEFMEYVKEVKYTDPMN